MILGARDTEQHRVRVGFLFLAIGLLLLLWAWGNWVFRESVPTKAQTVTYARDTESVPPSTDDPAAARIEAVRTLPLILAFSLVVILLVLLGGYAMLRTARRHRAAIDRPRAAPTDARDVWSMHKLPTSAEDEGA